MIHHVRLEVADLQRSAAFYDALLAPLGWRRHFDEDGTVGWGIAKPVFFVTGGGDSSRGFGLVSFSARGVVAVKAAWEAGVAAGGEDVRRPEQGGGAGSGSYSAQLADPDGHRVEVTIGAD